MQFEFKCNKTHQLMEQLQIFKIGKLFIWQGKSIKEETNFILMVK